MDEVEKLIFSLRNGKVQTRRDSAYLLGEKGDSRAIPALSQALEDNDTYVRERARDSLRQLTENGKPKEEQKFEFVVWLAEWWVYCIFTPSFSGTKLSKFDEENKFDSVKSWLYNTTTIMIPIWILSLLISEDLLRELGEVLGLVVLISPPYLIYFAWKLKLKGKDTYAILFLRGQILIIIFYILVICGTMILYM